MNLVRPYLRSLLPLVILCLLATATYAQDAEVINGVCVPVSSITKNSDGTWSLSLGWGSKRGIMKGSRGGTFHPAAETKKPDGTSTSVGTEYLGRAEITAVEENSATAVLKPEGAAVPEANDLVTLPVRIPGNVYQGVVFRVAITAAQFEIAWASDAADNGLVVSMDKALSLHSEEEETALLQKVVADLKATAHFTEDLKSESGNYVGPVKPTMENATVKDVREFLDFVAEFPGKYQGRTFKIAETYATWVLNGKPNDRAYILRRAPEMDDRQLATFIANLKRDKNLPQAAIEDWKEIAVDNAIYKSVDTKIYVRVLRAAAPVLQDPTCAVAAQLSEGIRSYMEQVWAKGKPSMAGLEQAMALADQLPEPAVNDENEKVTRTYWKSKILQKRALLFSKAPDYPAAAREAIQAFELVQNATTENWHAVALRTAESAGDNLLKTGNFESAAKYYELALKHARALHGGGALRAEVEMKNHLASIANERGDPATAIKVRQEALDLARQYDYADLVYLYEWALGGDLYDASRYQEALPHYTAILKGSELKTDKSDQVNLLRNIGLCEGYLGQAKQAEERFRQALSVAEQTKPNDLIPHVYASWASVQYQAGQYSEAAKLYRNAIKQFDESKAGELIAVAYSDLGMTLNEAREYAEAQDAYSRSAALYEKLGMQARRTRALVNLSDVYSKSGRLAEAEKTIEEVIGNLRASRDLKGLSQALVQMSYFHYLRYELGKSRGESEEALKLAIEAGDPEAEQVPIRQLTMVYSRMGEATKAETLIKDALTRAQGRKDEISVGAYQFALSGVYGDMGKSDLMRQAAEAALQIFTKNNLPYWTALTYTQLAAVESWEGKHDEARKQLSRARELLKSEEDYSRMAGGLEARLYKREANYRQAIEILRKVDALAVKRSDQVTHLDALSQIALIQMDQREYELALPNWDAILKANTEDVISRVSALVNRAETLVYVGRFAEADEAAKDAVATSQKYQLHWLPMVLGYRAKYLAMWARKTSDSKQAAARIDEATKLLNLAEPEARKEDDIHSLLVVHSAWGHRAVLLAERENSLPVTVDPLPKEDGAPWFADELVDIATKLRLTPDEWEARFLRGTLRNYRDDVDGAIEDLKASIKIIGDQALQYAVLGEQSSSTVYQSDKERPFTTLLTVYDRKAQQLTAQAEQMARKAAEASDPALAKDFANEEKAARSEIAAVYAQAREVLDAMRKFQLLTSSAGLSLPSGSTEVQSAAMRYQALFRKQKEIEQRLSEEYDRKGELREEVIKMLQERLEQQRAQIEAETKLIREQYPDLAKELELEVSDLTSFAQQHLNADEALIEPVLVPGRLIVFVARNNNGQAEIRSFSSQAESERLSSDLQLIWKAASSPSLDFALENSTQAGTPAFVAAEMYDRLFAPAEPALAGVKTVLISATGSLRYVPFHVLLAPGPDNKRVFLNDRYNIVYLTRSGSRGTGNAVTYSKAPVVAVANPDGSLPEADVEVGEIRTLWHGVPGTPFELRSRQDATVMSVNMTLGRVLAQSRGTNTIFHIATHGKAGTLPSESYLLFADERVRQDEISRKLMNAGRVSLAVLSGCETALGTLDERGAGVTGLAYEFQRMGVHTVLATLWKLDSETGKDFMTDFYKRLANGNSVGDSVRESRAAIRSNPKTSHPYYWAPFVLIGEWR